MFRDFIKGTDKEDPFPAPRGYLATLYLTKFRMKFNIFHEGLVEGESLLFYFFTFLSSIRKFTFFEFKDDFNIKNKIWKKWIWKYLNSIFQILNFSNYF